MSHPLRVALLVDPVTLSVQGEHAPKLAAELLGRGHVVRGFGAPPGRIPRSGAAAETEESSPGGPVGIVRFGPDAIVAYDALSPAAVLGARAARVLRAPLILVEADAPGGGRRWQRVLRRTGKGLWGRYVRRSATRVVALDPVTGERAEREGFSPALITVLPPGIDLAQYRPGLTTHLVSQHRLRGRLLLYVGRIEPPRGLDTLIAAFARTVGQRDDWSLVLAGEGSQRPALRAMCDRLGVGARVHWLARPRREELPGLLGAATLFAMPALDNEPLGHNVQRALACGLPVLASDQKRFRFFVEPEETGLLAPAGDVQAWAETIRRAASAPTARQRWGANARRISEERFSWSAVAAEFERLLIEGCQAAQQLEQARAARRASARRVADGEAGAGS